jgi:hypothetical protein
MDKIIEALREKIDRGNPNFTVESFKRTVEVCIIEVKQLPFMTVVSDAVIEDVISSITAEWNIEDRIRNFND